jgi:hypothetical protein
MMGQDAKMNRVRLRLTFIAAVSIIMVDGLAMVSRAHAALRRDGGRLGRLAALKSP